MNKVLASIALISTVLFTSCNSELTDKDIDGRFISGEISNAEGKEMVLFVFENGKQTAIDTVVVENDKFKFETKTKDLRLYFIITDPDDKGSQPVYLISDESDKNITLVGDYPDFSKTVTITGSEQSQQIKAYQDMTNNLFESKKAAFDGMRLAQGDSIKQKTYLKTLDSLTEITRGYASNHILSNSGSLAGWLMLNEFYPNTGTGVFNEEYLTYYEKVSNGVAAKYPKSEYPGLINQDIQNIKLQIQKISKQKEMSQGSVQAPDFKMTKPDGTGLALSDLKGQVVLLDFWASWCGPCRKENPNVVANYYKFKDKGFTILSVSLDKDKAAWVKAIAADNLSWSNHVSELKGWSCSVATQYGVSSIPASFLIDKNGLIIASNLRGPELGAKLTEVLGK